MCLISNISWTTTTKNNSEKLIHDKFNNNFKEVNATLVQHIERIERNTRENKPA